VTRQVRRLTVDVEFEDGLDPAEVHTALIDALSAVAYVANDYGFAPLSVIAEAQARPVPPPHPATMAGRLPPSSPAAERIVQAGSDSA
jgi:hypothetical protein